MGSGLLVGAWAVDYGTSLGDLAVMGAVTGVVLGATQGLALPRRASHTWIWVVASPLLWALAWVVTTLAGVHVEDQFIIVGVSGALTMTALSGLLLQRLLPVADDPDIPAQAALAASSP